MKHVSDVLARTIACLDDFGVHYALIGGLAVSVRSEPRFTRDVDIAVAVDSDEAAEQLVRAMFGRGFELHMQIEQKTDGRLATCRLTHRDDPGSTIVDLFFASSGIEHEVIAAADMVALTDSIELPVVQSEDLIVLKLLAVANRRNAQDTQDVVNLLQMVDPERLDRTRMLIRLVSHRRPQSGKNLQAVFEQLLEQVRETD